MDSYRELSKSMEMLPFLFISLFLHSVHVVINMTLDTSSLVYNLYTTFNKQSFTLHIT